MPLKPSDTRWLAIGLVLLALVARAAYVATHTGLLAEDRDGYASLADALCEHGVFSFAPEQAIPTAYRPPLYPLLLAGLRAMFGRGLTPIAVVQILMGLATVGLVWSVAVRLAGPAGAVAAGLVAAVDPLLVDATALRMTECASALLTAAAVWALVRLGPAHTGRDALVAGVVLGLGALCRPIVWGWAVLTLVLVKLAAPLPARARLVALLALFGGFLGAQAPWLVRNWFELGRPVWTTTHGGYTFLLGNNPVFYREVVSNPDVDVWPKESHQAWWDRESGAIAFLSEPERDACLYRRAFAFIRENPGAFVECSWLKLRRLWAWRPHAAAGTTLGLLMGLWYGVQSVLLVLGLAVTRCWRWPWSTMAAALLVFTATHTLYWSNMRMRTPLVPVIAIFVGVGAAWLIGRVARPADGCAEETAPE